jgi:glycosyltransferase involved in cell wall biosynthesis
MTATNPRLVPLFQDRPVVVGGPAEPERLPAPQRVLVAVPAYNEERFIGSVVHGVQLQGFDCVVIDDGSTDRTVEIATAAGARVECHGENRGKSAAVTRALQVARRMSVDVLVLMDGDWQHDPREIPSLLEPVLDGTADIVSGSRFLNDERRRIPSVRGAGLRAVTTLSNVASGQRLTDSQTGFRAFSRQAIENLRFRSVGFSIEVEIQFMAALLGLKQLEVPISVSYADPPKRNVFGQGAQVLDGIIRLVAHYRPLLFFGVPGVLSLVTGLIIGVFVLDIYQTSAELAGGYALLAVLLIILGAIGTFAGLLLNVLGGIFHGLERQIDLLGHRVEGTDASQ